MKFKIVKFLLWANLAIERWLDSLDTCSYLGCKNRAETECITGGHRHCYEHESNYYSDVEMCNTCFESMTPEEIALDQKEQKEFELESYGA